MKKKECCMALGEVIGKQLGGQEMLPEDQTTTANVFMETGKRVLGMLWQEKDKETCWQKEEVQKLVRSKRLAKNGTLRGPKTVGRVQGDAL